MELPLIAEGLALLGASLAIGLLIGLERGWTFREAKEGKRLAGIRTFGLIGLLGGCCGLLSLAFGGVFLGLSFIGLTLILTIAYAVNLKKKEDISITTMIAAMLTFILGCMATLGHVAIAGSAAVVTAILLSIKPVLHGWIKKLEKEELYATLKLLLISVVLLSIFPNKGFGPWKAFNPFEIWWMVVLVACISYVGYFAIKIGGVRKGGMFTAFFAGLASSTALTFHYSKLASDRKDLVGFLSVGILMASGLMFLRVALIVGLLSPMLLQKIILPILCLAFILFIPVVVMFIRTDKSIKPQSPILQNPLELKSALAFGLLLVIVTFLSQILQHNFGASGLYTLGVLVGFFDVDSFILTLSRMKTPSLETMSVAAMLASLSNTVVKGILAAVIGGPKLIKTVTLPLLGVVVFGLGLTWILLL